MTRACSRLGFGACLVVAIMLAGPSSAQTVREGTYNVYGTNPDGSSYSGTATITLASETTCIIEWETGDTVSEGICMLFDDTFAASYILNDEIGLAVYRVKGDSVLEGAWTITGQDGAGTEMLSRR
jgi:hypothetical protein